MLRVWELLMEARRTMRQRLPLILIEKLKSDAKEIGRFLNQYNYLAAEHQFIGYSRGGQNRFGSWTAA